MTTAETLSQDMKISYFISSNSQKNGGEKTFIWPPLPDISMGEEFIKAIKVWHYQVEVWIQDNPDRFKSAVNGVYIPLSTYKPLTSLRHKPTGNIGHFIQEFNHSDKMATTHVKLNSGDSYFACSSEFEATV